MIRAAANTFFLLTPVSIDASFSLVSFHLIFFLSSILIFTTGVKNDIEMLLQIVTSFYIWFLLMPDCYVLALLQSSKAFVIRLHFNRFTKRRIYVFIRKYSVLQDSPPAAGRSSDIILLRRSPILHGGLFSFLENLAKFLGKQK